MSRRCVKIITILMLNCVRSKIMHKDKKINVLQLISSLRIGGAEKLLIELLEENVLDRNSTIEFTVVIMNDEIDDGLKKKILSIGCNVYFLNRPKGYKHPKYFFELLNIVKKHRIDFIHSHESC